MHGGVGLCSCRHLVDGLPGTSARYERRLVVTPCAVETVGSVMHGGVELFYIPLPRGGPDATVATLKIWRVVGLEANKSTK